MQMTIIAIVITFIVAAGVTWLFADNYHKNVASQKVGSAEEKARQIIDDAVKTAETTKREAELAAKEESIQRKNELDKEIQERRAEVHGWHPLSVEHALRPLPRRLRRAVRRRE